jgi:hypothetical protein
VKAARAHVHQGRIVLDEPVDLPDGTAVDVLLPEDDDLEVDRAELEAALEASTVNFAQGEFEDARAFAARLAAAS